MYSGLNLNQDKATKPQTVQIVRQGEVTPSWFKVNPLYLQSSDQRKLPMYKNTPRADLQRTEILQECRIPFRIGNNTPTFPLSFSNHQHTAAMSTYQRNNSGRIRLHRRTTAWAISFKKGRFFHSVSNRRIWAVISSEVV